MSMLSAMLQEYGLNAPGGNPFSAGNMDFGVPDDPLMKRYRTLAGLQERVAQYGYEPPARKKKSLLDYLINGLSIGQYAVANVGENLLGVSENSGKGLQGLWDDFAGGIKAGLSMDDGKPGDWQDIFRKKFGLANTGNYAGDVALNFARETLGSVGNIVFDPLTYVSAGKSKLAQRGGSLLAKSKLAKHGLSLMDDAGKKAAAGMLAREYGDDLVKQFAKGTPEFAHKMKSYYDDALNVLRKDKGGIKLNLPSMVDVPGQAKKELHLPFFRESDNYVGKTIAETDNLWRKLGVPQAFKAATAKLTGADTDFISEKIFHSMKDQALNNPSGIGTRLFVKPVEGAGVYDPVKAIAQAKGKVDPQEIIDTVFGKHNKYGIIQDPQKVQELRNAYGAIMQSHPEIRKLAEKIEDKVTYNSARAAHKFLDKITQVVSEAVSGKPYKDVDIDLLREVKANLLNFSDDPIMKKARNSWVRFFNDRPVGLEKTLMGRFVDQANALLQKEYNLPVDMSKLLRRYHLNTYGDKVDVENVVDESKKFFKNDDEMKKVYFHFMKPDKYKVDDSWTDEMKDGVDWLRKMFDSRDGHKVFVYEAEHGLFEHRKSYLPQVFQKGPKDPKDIVGKGSLTMSAEQFQADMESFIRYLEVAGENSLQRSSQAIKKIINRIITRDGSGKIKVPDGHLFSRMIDDIDEAIMQGRDPLMDIPSLVKIRLEAGYRMARQHELLEGVKKIKGMSVKLPDGLMKHEQFVKPPPGFVFGKNLGIPQLNQYMVDENAAKYLVKHFVPQHKNEWLDLYDKALKEWKWMVTVPNPTFHTRNALGNVITNWFANVNNPEVYWTAGKLQKANPEKLASMKIKMPWGEMSGEEFMNLAREKGVLEGFLEKEILGNDLASRINRGWSKGKEVIGNALGGDFIEKNARLAHFIDKMQKGWSSEAAAASVQKFLFDYSDLGPGDEWLKRIIPFWTWTKNNIPLQIENLTKRPGKFNIMAKMKHAFEGGSERSKWLEENEERPEWLRESLHFRLPDRFNIKGKPTIAKLGLPMEDLLRAGDPKEWWSSLSPPLKLAAEYQFNKHSFFGNDIIKDELIPDKELHTVKTDPLVAAPLSYVPGVRDLLQIRKKPDPYSGRDRYEMNAWAHHLYSSALRPVKEISKAADPESAFITRMMNLAGPARVYQYDPQRQEMHEVQEEIRRMRAVLRKLSGYQVRGGIGRGTGR